MAECTWDCVDAHTYDRGCGMPDPSDPTGVTFQSLTEPLNEALRESTRKAHYIGHYVSPTILVCRRTGTLVSGLEDYPEKHSALCSMLLDL